MRKSKQKGSLFNSKLLSSEAITDEEISKNFVNNFENYLHHSGYFKVEVVAS
jgi:hypothetical protein